MQVCVYIYIQREREIHVYIYIYIYMHIIRVCVYIYIYIQRERHRYITIAILIDCPRITTTLVIIYTYYYCNNNNIHNILSCILLVNRNNIDANHCHTMYEIALPSSSKYIIFYRIPLAKFMNSYDVPMNDYDMI